MQDFLLSKFLLFLYQFNISFLITEIKKCFNLHFVSRGKNPEEIDVGSDLSYLLKEETNLKK